jgi:hypothetical protein
VNRSEWAEVCKGMVARWPGFDWASATSVGALDVWFGDLEEHDAADVAAAVQALYRTGREFPPNGGQILAKVDELDTDDPDWAAAFRWLKRLAMAGYTSPMRGRVTGPRGEPSRAQQVQQRILDEMPGQVRGFVEALGDVQLRDNLNDIDNGEARLRTKWQTWCRGRAGDRMLVGLPGGLSAVRRIRGGEPRQIGAVLKALPGGSDDGEGAA